MNDLVFNHNGAATTNSLLIAKTFSKEHKNVLRDIDNLDCSEEFSQLNFEPSKYKDERGKMQRMFIISKDGFVFLVMGYKGKRAGMLKESYINNYNKMQSWIAERENTKLGYRPMTDALMAAKGNPKPHHFSNENFMINDIILGCSSRKLKKEKGIDNFREIMTNEQLFFLNRLQAHDTALIELGYDYEGRKKNLTNYYNTLKARKLTN